MVSAPEEIDELPPGCHYDADGDVYDGNVGGWHSDLPFDSVDTPASSDCDGYVPGYVPYEDVEFVC